MDPLTFISSLNPGVPGANRLTPAVPSQTRPEDPGGRPQLGRPPAGSPLGALVLSAPLFVLVAAAGTLLAPRLDRPALPRATFTLDLDQVVAPPPPPPPPAGGSPARSMATPATPDLPVRGDVVPVLAPATLAPGLPGGEAGGLPGGVPGGVAGGVQGGQAGGTPGGAPGGSLEGIVPPRFDAAYLQNPPPAYPPLSRRLGEEGRVLLRVLVSPEGRATSLEIRTSSGFSRLDQAAAEAVRRWRFTPARHGTEAVPAWVLIPITFNLDA